MNVRLNIALCARIFPNYGVVSAGENRKCGGERKIEHGDRAKD